MNTTENTPSVIGAPFGGGFYAGRILIAGVLHALIVASKAEGERTGPWNGSDKAVAGATSYFDGAQNTAAMAEAGSELAKWARDLRIGECDDWYIPSQDELEVIYRNLKPTAETNARYGRSGVNASAAPPSYAYTATEPAQTLAPEFADEGAQAFADDWYWTSTQHAAYADYAWCQYFDIGYQGSDDESASLRARAVRRLKIS